MLTRTRAIVLRSLESGEADLIVTYLTEDSGLVKAFAKSPRKTGSRFGSSLEPFSFVRISLFGKEGTGLLRITGSDLLKSFQEIRDDLRKVLFLAPAINLTIALLPEREPESEAFSLLLRTLRNASNSRTESVLVLSLSYIIKLLHIHGFSPKLDSCSGCNRESPTYYISHGSLLCSECSARYGEGSYIQDRYSDPRRISEGAKRLYGALKEWDERTILKIKPSKVLLYELMGLLEDHIRYHVIQKDSPLLFHQLQARVFQGV